MTTMSKRSVEVVAETIGDAGTGRLVPSERRVEDVFVATVGHDKERRLYYVDACIEQREDCGDGCVMRSFVLFGGIRARRVVLDSAARFNAKTLQKWVEAASAHIAKAREYCLEERARRLAAGESY